MSKQFKIDSYEHEQTAIVVMLEKYLCLIPVTIPLDKFEWWLRITDRLEWQLTTSDHTGEPQQFNGTMSIDEYWDSNKEYIHADLYDYICTHPIEHEGQVYENSLAHLVLAFDLHNAGRINPLPERWEHEQEILN